MSDIMQKKTKYSILVIIIMVLILADIILAKYPLKIDSNTSMVHSIPFLFWIVNGLFSLMIFIMAYKTRSKVLVMILSALYFLVFYSQNLFFIIIPEQSDIGASGLFLSHIEENIFIDKSVYTYFNCPVFFTHTKLLTGSLGITEFQTINIGFFIFLLAIPLVFPLTMVSDSRKNRLNFLLYPAAYIILSFFFINSQYIPQFISLIYLILTIGTYVRLQETNSVKYYYLTIFFFILCVYSHPFMFVFFILSLILHKSAIFIRKRSFSKVFGKIKDYDNIFDYLLNLFLRFKEYRSVLKNIFQYWRNYFGSLIGKRAKKGISVLLLIAIYIYGYQNGFYQFEFLRDIINPPEGRGETWFLVSYLFGSKKTTGLVTYDTYPFFDLIPREIYLIVRNLNILILFSIAILIIVSLFLVSKKRINIYDIFLMIGSSFTIFLGFIFPGILGQRAIQVIFVNVPQYMGSVYKNRKLISIIAIIITLAPLMFSLNFAIDSTLGGFTFLEDESTLSTGKFVYENAPGNSTVFTTDRAYYPISTLDFYDPSRIHRESPVVLAIEHQDHISGDMIVYNDKLQNNIEYYDYNNTLLINYTSCIYDQGTGKVYY